jgi:hypothetical protein
MQRAALARRRPFCLAEQCCSLLVIPALVAGLQLTSRDALVEGWIPGSHAESMPPAWPRDDNWTSAEGAEVVRDAVFGLARRERRGCQRTRSASGTGKCARAGKARGDENRGAGRSWPSMCIKLEAAIAAPPRHKLRSSIFPGSLPCPGPTSIFAPAIDDHGATLTAPADLRRPISCSSVSARLHPGLRNGLAGFYVRRGRRG